MAGSSRAVARPVGPTLEPDGQAEGPCATRSSKLHFLKPLPENLRPLGRSTVIVCTVVPGLFTTCLNESRTFFGFFFVPALLGEAETSRVASPLGVDTWAAAPAARASVADAATAPVSSLRKFSPPRSGLTMGRPVRVPRD